MELILLDLLGCRRDTGLVEETWGDRRSWVSGVDPSGGKGRREVSSRLMGGRDVFDE